MKKFFYAVSCCLFLGSPLLAAGSSSQASSQVSEVDSQERLGDYASDLLLSQAYADFVEGFKKQMEGRELRVSRIKTMSLNDRNYVSMSLQSKAQGGDWQDDKGEIFAELLYNAVGKAQVFGVYYKLSDVAPVFVSAEGTGVAVPESVGSLLLTREFSDVVMDLVKYSPGYDIIISHFSTEKELGRTLAKVWVLARSAGNPYAPELKIGHVKGRVSVDADGKTVFDEVTFVVNDEE